MAREESTLPIRISKIAGRYLVFDHRDISLLRRHHNTCAVLVGTTPQNPTQNTFLGVPVELRSEDAAILVEKGVAVVHDETMSHSAVLSDPKSSARAGYIDALRTRRKAVERAIAEESKKRRIGRPGREPAPTYPAGTGAGVGAGTGATLDILDAPGDKLLFPPAGGSPSSTLSCSVNPTTTSRALVGNNESVVSGGHVDSPLYRHLHSAGYYMTPGLRFGCRYSVYPGDPLRFHAHFLANEYGWDEEIPVLDLVGSGRLGTAVKKGFLLGGEVAEASQPSLQVRAFCVEWAGM